MEPFLSALYDHAIPEVGSMDQQIPKISILPRDSLSQVCPTVFVLHSNICSVFVCRL